MKNLASKFRARVSDDSGAITTLELILYIALAVVLAFGVGKLIYEKVMAKATATGDCIENSNLIFQGNGNANCG